MILSRILERLTPRHWIGAVMISIGLSFWIVPGIGFGTLDFIRMKFGIYNQTVTLIYLGFGVLEWIIPTRKPHWMFVGLIPEFAFSVAALWYCIDQYPLVPGHAVVVHLLLVIASIALLYFWTRYVPD